MNPPAKLSDLMTPLEWNSTEHFICFDRETGSIVCVDNSVMNAAEEGDEEKLKDLSGTEKDEVDLALAIVNDKAGRFIAPPDRFDFDEYGQMEQFIYSLKDDTAAEELSNAIRGRGAFRYFKDTAERLGLLDNWYRFRDQAMKEFVIEWAEDHNVRYEDDTKNPES